MGAIKQQGYFFHVISVVLLCSVWTCKTTISPKVQCHLENGPNDTDIISLNEHSTLECFIMDGLKRMPLQLSSSNGVAKSFAYMDVVVYNSTWKLTQKLPCNRTGCTMVISEDNFFLRITQYDLIPNPSTAYIHTSLKWFMTLNIYDPTLISPLQKKLVIVHPSSERISHRAWGKPVASTESLSQYIASSRYDVIYAISHCQTGSSLMILSNSAKTYIFATWDSFSSSRMQMYELDCTQTDLSNCSNLAVSDAVITPNKLLVLSSEGMLISEEINKDCQNVNCLPVAFYSLNNTFDGYNLTWNGAKLFFTPFCSQMDYILPTCNMAFLQVQSVSGQKLVFGAKEPFKKWTYLPKLSTNSSNSITLTYDQQSASIISIFVDSMDNTAKAKVYRLPSLDSEPVVAFPHYSFTEGTQTSSIQTLLQSNHHFYVTVGSSLWLSTDGGNLFSRIFRFESDEIVLQLIGYEPMKSFALLTSKGRIYFGKCGMRGLKLLAENETVSRILAFNHLGHVVVIDSKQSSSQLQTKVILIKDDETCSYSMEYRPNLKSIYFLQFKEQLKFIITARLFPDTTARASNEGLLSINIGNPRGIRTRFQSDNLDDHSHTIEIELTSQFLVQSVTSVSVYLRNVSSSCPIASHNFIIIAACPMSKRLTFDYGPLLGQKSLLSMWDYTSAYDNATRGLLQELPVNYRPPSSLAVAIPFSPNVYNLHPDKINETRFLTYEFAERHKLKGFCMNARKRSECSCTAAQKFSSLEKHSDCREKVYKVFYDTFYNIKLSIGIEYDVFVDDVTTDNVTSMDMTKFFVYLEEINGRDSSVYTAQDNQEEFCSQYPDHLMCRARSQGEATINEREPSLLKYMTSGLSNHIYNASQLSIKFMGTGLFHFRIILVNGFSFCKLHDEFQVYVINPPLPFPTGTIIRLTVSFMMGGSMIFIYMRYLYATVPPRQDVEHADQSETVTGRERSSYPSEGDIKILRSKQRPSIRKT
ncbi:unnamed protein product [Clavelina lepadiformis]|uniref:Cation channel sperm-associated protein subunit beta n=1 Tax=Clavelina lepadiformis TaxID=159417 RepID=A0ABP0F5C5_CLALP